MPDVSLQIILEQKTHDVGGGIREASRYRRGDIVDVHRSSDIAAFDGTDWIVDIGSTVMGFVHVRNVPPDRFRNMRRVFSDPVEVVTGQVEVEDPLLGPVMEDVVETQRRRRWRVRLPDMPARQRNALLRDRQITVGWLGFRDKIRRKVVVNRLDQSLDDESSAVADGDLP